MDETIINRVRALRACGATLLEIAETMRDVDPTLVRLAWLGSTIIDADAVVTNVPFPGSGYRPVAFCYVCGTIRAPHSAVYPHNCLVCDAEASAECS